MRRVHAFCYMICWWESQAFEPLRDFLMRCHAFEPGWDLLRRVHALCCTICLWDVLSIRFHPLGHAWHQVERDVRMFEDDVTWPEHMHLVMQGCSLGGGGVVWVDGVNVGHLKNFLPSWGCHRTLWSEGSSFRLSSSCALDVHVIGLLVFPPVFHSAFAFNGDLTQWDVASVTTMYASKSIRLV